MSILGLTIFVLSVGLWKLLRDASFQKQYNLPRWIAVLPAILIMISTVITMLGFFILIHHGER